MITWGHICFYPMYGRIRGSLVTGRRGGGGATKREGGGRSNEVLPLKGGREQVLAMLLAQKVVC